MWNWRWCERSERCWDISDTWKFRHPCQRLVRIYGERKWDKSWIGTNEYLWNSTRRLIMESSVNPQGNENWNRSGANWVNADACWFGNYLYRRSSWADLFAFSNPWREKPVKKDMPMRSWTSDCLDKSDQNHKNFLKRKIILRSVK